MNQILSSYKLLCIFFVLCNVLNVLSLNLKTGEACASSCSGKDKIFKYEEDKIYVYDFLSKHTIKNPNAEKETLQLELKGKAEVSKISACDFGLKLSGINLKESLMENKEMIKEYNMMSTVLEKYSLRFGFDDGRIVGVCQDTMDSEFAVNVKKAIISSLQVSLDSLDAPNYITETDISGDCITEYSTKSEKPNFVIVKKIKSISGCARKNKYFSSLSGRQFEEPMENRHLALLDGSYECDIKIKRSEGLKESICKEIQIFKPFSSEKTGSFVEVIQEVKFDSIKNGKLSTQTPNTRSDLTMNHGEQAPHFMKVKQVPAIEIAKQLCEAFEKNAVKREKTQLFVNFIRSLTDADYKAIQEVDKYFGKNAVCKPNEQKLKTILLDALPYTKTEDAFKFLIEDSNLQLFQNLGFSFLENASPNIIKMFAKKLDDSKFENSMLMILSSMIKSFCEKNSGCILNPDIIYATNQLVKLIENGCISKSKATTERFLFTLRALGNAGNFPDYKKLIKILETCISPNEAENDVKIFAVESLRQFPCHADLDTFLWNIYDDISSSSEVRIHAYLSLIRCPFRETFRKVIQKLNNENNQQLGSFVWSHISNLMETSDRFKTELRDMLQIFTKPMADLARKFNLDFRSYSKNIEKTFQRGYSAVKIDSNILFSSSPIPSSLSANITLDVFGRSINILEFGIRGKGISEKIFGNLNLKPHNKAHTDIIKMHKKGEIKPERLNVALYSRIMGREIYFNPNILSDLTMKLFNPNRKVSIEKSLLIIDATISVSTITGFPIQLIVESAMSADIQANSQFIANDIDLSIQKNVALQVTGKLQINGHCTKIGIQSFGTVSSDAEFGGKLKLVNGVKPDGDIAFTDYQFEINKIPDDKKLISISSELNLVHNLKPMETKPKYSTVLDKCSGNAFLELRGIKICASVSSAPKYNTFFPNLKAEINIKKFNGFRFQFIKQDIQKPIKKLINLLISTSFQGGEKETFKFQFQRDVKSSKSMYEVSLWNKDIYAKLDIENNKISGEFKYGENEAKLSGSFQYKGIVSSLAEIKIKTANDEMNVVFKQSYNQGLQLSLEASKKNDKEFSLISTTTMKISDHKLFNYFERFRHSTTVKLSGENEFLLKISRDKANNPVKENKATFETYYKTKSKNNFFIKQEYFWSKYSVVDKTISPVTGVNYTISLSQEFEVSDKKFNMDHKINYFISNGFLFFDDKPSLIIFKLETFDKLKKSFTRQINSKLFFDIKKSLDGTVILQNHLNHPGWKIYQKLNAKAIWKQNTLGMYDLEAEITESELLKLLLKHKFTSTQNGVSSLEIIAKKTIFKIDSELSLPKSHILTVSWPENTLIIDSKVDTKSTSPFISSVSHDIKLNSKIVATITNTATFDYKNALFSFQSMGKAPGKDLYSLNLESQLKSDFTRNKMYYDFFSKLEMKIPSNEIDFNVETKHFANIQIDGKIKLEDKAFESKLIYQNKDKKRYGYEFVVEGIKSPESFSQYKTIIYKGSIENKYVIKFSKMNKRYLFGLSIDSSSYLVSEFMWKLICEDEKITSSVLASVDLKSNEKYNFFYKNNMILLYKKNMYSLTWNGEYGKQSKSNLIPFQGSIKFYGTGVNEFDISCDISHPLLSRIKIAKFILGINFRSGPLLNEKDKIISNVLVKWQLEGERTAKYYELKVKGNYKLDFSKESFLDLEGVLVKDSSLNKLLEINTYVKLSTRYLESNLSYIYDKSNLLMNFKINLKNIENSILLMSIKTSNELLKELTLSSELKTIGTTFQGKSNFNLLSVKSYNIEITQVRKLDLNNGLDLVSNVKWVSNIPYLDSGSYVYGILVSKNGNSQINLSLNYKNAKKINLKFSFDKKSNELQAFAESYIIIPVKFSLSLSKLAQNSFTINSEFGYKEKFLKFSDSKIIWSFENNIRSFDFSTTLLSSNEMFNEFSIAVDSYYERDNFFKSYKSNLNSKFKGKSLQVYKIDLPSGEIKIDSKLGQFIKNWQINNLQFDLKYKFNSIRDMSIKYKFLADPIFDKSEIELIYFRKVKDENPKLIEGLGEAMWFCKINYQYKDVLFKKIGFIDKDMMKGSLVLNINIPILQIKLDETALNIEMQKVSENVYKGTAKYKTHHYQFKYEYIGYDKLSLLVEAVSTNSEPKIVEILYNNKDNFALKIMADKLVNFNVNMNSVSTGKKSGKVELTFKEKNIVNIQVNADIKLPSDIQTLTDVIKGLMKSTKGIHIKSEVTGKIFDTNIKRKTEIYHLESEQYPGGIKSYFNNDIEIESTKPIILKTSILIDRNYPKFDSEGSIFVEIDKKIKIDKSIKGKFVSKNDFMVNIKSSTMDKYSWNFLALYNENVVQTNIGFELPQQEFVFGIGFKKIRTTNDLNVHLAYLKNNYTASTNIGYLLKITDNNYFPINKEYYFEILKKYEFRINRKKDMEFDVTFNYDWVQPIKVKIILEIKDSKYVIELKGSSAFENIKDVNLKLSLEDSNQKEKPYKLNIYIKLNKKLISDLTLTFSVAMKDRPYQLKLNYKGNTNIKGEINLNIEKYEFSHTITVKDGNFKTELWTCKSNCQLKDKINCYLNHKSPVREKIIGFNWEKNFKRFELTWHKTKEQSLILTINRKKPENYILFENPINKIRLSSGQVVQHDENVGKLNLDITSVGKSNNKNVFINLDYSMKGSLRSDYTLKLKLNTSLMHKEINLSIKRDISLDIGDIYALEVKALFGNEKTPFFKLTGYLRQLSTRSYEIKLHSTNYDRFAILTVATIFASEEMTIEYKLEQSDMPASEFLLQYIPFRKFHMTNKKDFKIMLNRNIYQYGFRNEYALKLGSKGIDISAFSTFTRSPMRYYAELNTQIEKTVIHLRPVGNLIIGELYRKTSDQKIVDASLKINIDEKNILSSKLYWQPGLFDQIKKLFGVIFKPDNMKALMVQVYQNSENQLNKYLSVVKTDVIKNMNIPMSLEFMKGIANDWETFPKAIAISYENDDYYMKTILEKFTNYLTNLDLSTKFFKFQTAYSELRDVISNGLYDWIIEAKLYTMLYEPIKNNLDSFTYDKVKNCITKIVNLCQNGFKIFKVLIYKIGDVLDIISDKAKNIAILSSNFKETFQNLYKNSLIMDILPILEDIRTEILNLFQKIMKSDIVKQRIKYYQDALQNSQDIINLIITFKNTTLEYFKSSYAVKNIVKTIQLIRSMKYKEAFLNFIKIEESEFQMDLDKASIDFKIYVPQISLGYFKAVRTFVNWLPLKAVYQISKSTLGEKLLELFYRYEYVMFNYGSLNFDTFKKLFPPFAKNAWVLDGTSILTFDGNSVKIGPGECTYLLARDFKKGSFSITMSIEKSNDVKFELFYINKITIKKDGKVKVDGKSVEILPAVFEDKKRNVVIYRDEDLTKIKTSEGLVIKYFYNLNALKVMVTGKWHGSIKGLLGSNDFDKGNDLSTPNGLLTHDAGVLSKSWSLDKCEGKTKTGLYSIKLDPKQLQECVNLFQPDSLSYLKRCYSLINPEPYLDLCQRSLQYAPMKKDEFKNILCSLSRNYVIRCKNKGILIRLDKNCVNCGNKKLNSKLSVHDLQKNPKFHYIFIMEQSYCINSYRLLIENMVKMMAFKNEAIFTLVSYNGKDVYNEVHFKTIKNKANVKSNEFMDLLKNFYSKDQLSPDKIGDKTDQPGKAIYDVIKMSSIPGYTEKIILVSCASCSEHQQYIYSLLAGLLNKAGISITYLTKQTFTGKEADENTVGIGKKMSYFFKDDKINKVEWKRNVQSPRDACSPLARLNQGFVWSLKPLLQKPQISDMRMRRLAETIKDELIKVKGSTSQTCYCTAGNYESGKTECKVAK